MLEQSIYIFVQEKLQLLPLGNKPCVTSICLKLNIEMKETTIYCQVFPIYTYYVSYFCFRDILKFYESVEHCSQALKGPPASNMFRILFYDEEFSF